MVGHRVQTSIFSAGLRSPLDVGNGLEEFVLSRIRKREHVWIGLISSAAERDKASGSWQSCWRCGRPRDRHWKRLKVKAHCREQMQRKQNTGISRVRGDTADLRPSWNRSFSPNLLVHMMSTPKQPQNGWWVQKRLSCAHHSPNGWPTCMNHEGIRATSRPFFR